MKSKNGKGEFGTQIRWVNNKIKRKEIRINWAKSVYKSVKWRVYGEFGLDQRRQPKQTTFMWITWNLESFPSKT